MEGVEGWSVDDLSVAEIGFVLFAGSFRLSCFSSEVNVVADVAEACSMIQIGEEEAISFCGTEYIGVFLLDVFDGGEDGVCFVFLLDSVSVDK